MVRRKQLTPAQPAAPAWSPNQFSQVRKWILAGAAEQDVIDAIATAYPDQQPKPLILACLAHLARSADCDAHLLAGFCLEATRNLYRRMLEIGDFSGALKAVKQLHDLARQLENVCNDREPEAAKTV